MKLALSVCLVFTTSALAFEVHGHRGARARFPENTLPAMEHALKVGVDVLETDLAVTKDGVLVLSHDPLINGDICVDASGARIGDKKIPIHTLTLKDVKSFDCGTLKNPKFDTQTPVPGTNIPTLEEFLKFVKASKAPAAKRVQFNIETKSFPDHPELTPTPAEFAKLLYAALKRAGVLKRTIVQSFDFRTLREMRKLDKTIRLAALIQDDVDLVKLSSELKSEIGLQILSPKASLLKPETVKAVQRLGVQVVPWTVNAETDWAALAAAGVDGIITDDPERLIQWRTKQSPTGK